MAIFVSFSVFRALRPECSQFALLLLQRSVQAGDEFEEAPAEALLLGLPLQRVEAPWLLPRGGGGPHVAARAGAAAQLRLGRSEELAGWPETQRPQWLFLSVGGAALALVQAGVVEGLLLGGLGAEDAAAAAAANAVRGPPGGGAGRAQASVHAG